MNKIKTNDKYTDKTIKEYGNILNYFREWGGLTLRDEAYFFSKYIEIIEMLYVVEPDTYTIEEWRKFVNKEFEPISERLKYECSKLGIHFSHLKKGNYDKRCRLTEYECQICRNVIGYKEEEGGKHE